MDLTLTDEQELFRATTRRFLDGTATTAQTRSLESTVEGFDRAWWRRGAELGWLLLLAPDHLGGGGLAGEALLDLAIVAEELGRLVAPGPLHPVSVVVDTIARVGTREQDDLLADTVDGTRVLAWAFYEGGPWDASTVRLEAEPTRGGFRLTGRKTIVEAANVASHLLVTARSGAGLTQFVVPVDAPGVTVTPLDGLDLTRRYGDVLLDGVELPTSAVVGEPGAAGDDVERQLLVATVLQCAETVGAMQRVFDFTLEYLSDRYSFGRPLSSYQALKHRIADHAVDLQASLAIADAAAKSVQTGAANAREMVSAAKAWIGDRSTDLVQDCVQLHGGIGVTWEHDLHLYLRRVTVNRVTYGTPDEHRARIATLVGL